jgi:hypothetical protein
MADPVETHPTIFGHEPIGRRPNVRRELLRLRRDPLERLLRTLDAGKRGLLSLSNERSRYEDAYWFYYLSLDRFLREMSVAARHRNGPYYVRKYGGKYTPSERRLVAKYKQIAPFLEYDLANCLIHARILLDRVAGLSRSFLSGGRLPSFTSFSDHKKFFEKLNGPYGAHEAYAEHIRIETNWFEMPVKAVRDKFIVHAAPRHWRFLGYGSGSDYELDLTIVVHDNDKPKMMIRVNALRLSYDIEKFLEWFSTYALNNL